MYPQPFQSSSELLLTAHTIVSFGQSWSRCQANQPASATLKDWLRGAAWVAAIALLLRGAFSTTQSIVLALAFGLIYQAAREQEKRPRDDKRFQQPLMP